MVERMHYDDSGPRLQPNAEQQSVTTEPARPQIEESVVQESSGRRLRQTAPIHRQSEKPSSPVKKQETVVSEIKEPAKSLVPSLVKRGVIGGVALGIGGALLAAGVGLTAPISIMVVAGSAMFGAMLLPILTSGRA